MAFRDDRNGGEGPSSFKAILVLPHEIFIKQDVFHEDDTARAHSFEWNIFNSARAELCRRHGINTEDVRVISAINTDYTNFTALPGKIMLVDEISEQPALIPLEDSSAKKLWRSVRSIASAILNPHTNNKTSNAFEQLSAWAPQYEQHMRKRIEPHILAQQLCARKIPFDFAVVTLDKEFNQREVADFLKHGDTRIMYGSITFDAAKPNGFGIALDQPVPLG